MGSRYNEEKPFAFYDPEQDREGHRGAPRSRPAPLSPRARSPGHAYSAPISPREQPFGHYDPDLDREGDRHGTSYGPDRRASPSRLDSRGGGRGAPLPYVNQDSGTLPMSQGYGRGAREPGYVGRGAPEPGYAGRGVPEPGYSGRGAPEPGYAGRGAPEPGYAGRGAPEPGYAGGGVPEPGYAGRGAPEPGHAGRGGYPPPPSQDFAGTSGRGRGYGDGEPGYGRAGRPAQMEDGPGHGASLGRGRGAVAGPLGAGRYVYGGLQQAEGADFDGAPPAPISSEYAHQVYASVFSDPVYGGAGKLNARAGYAEEPPESKQLHHKQDVLRHPDQF